MPKIYDNTYRTRTMPHKHRCRNDASEFEQQYLEHRKQFESGAAAIDFHSMAQSRILETTGCCYGECGAGDPNECCQLENEAGPEVHRSDEYYGFSTPISGQYRQSEKEVVPDTWAGLDTEDDRSFLDMGNQAPKLNGVELANHKIWVDTIPDADLAMMAADNCHRRVGGNQEFQKAYVPQYAKHRLATRNLHVHEKKCCNFAKDKDQTMRTAKHGMSTNKPAELVAKETSSPILLQSCKKRGYVNDRKKDNRFGCDVWDGAKFNNCRDCRFF